jgi:hypothetical protein
MSFPSTWHPVPRISGCKPRLQEQPRIINSYGGYQAVRTTCPLADHRRPLADLRCPHPLGVPHLTPLYILPLRHHNERQSSYQLQPESYEPRKLTRIIACINDQRHQQSINLSIHNPPRQNNCLHDTTDLVSLPSLLPSCQKPSSYHRQPHGNPGFKSSRPRPNARKSGV